MEIHHIGYLVKKIDYAAKAFKSLGFCMGGAVTYDAGRDAEICFLDSRGYRVELVAPRVTSPLHGLMKKYKNTAYHICYRVPSLEESVEKLEKDGWHLFKEAEEAPAIGKDAKVVFMMSADIGMIELLEMN